MSNLNFVLGIVHNTKDHSKNFIDKFTTLEIKNPDLFIPLKKDYLYHSNYSISLDDVSSNFISDLKKLDKKNIRRFSFDAGPCYRKVKIANNKYFPGEGFLESRQLIEMVGEEIFKLKSICKEKTSLAIENLNYYPTGAYEEDVCLPEFYNKISDNYNIKQF